VNVQDIITRVRRRFGDEAAVQVTNDDVIRWINDGQIAIVKRNDSALQKTTTLNLIAGQSVYALPADLLILRSLRYKYTSHASYSRLAYKSIQQFDEQVDGWDGSLYNDAAPRFFTKDENNVILFPTPDESATGGLKVLYNQVPVSVTSTSDDLSLPLIYHSTIDTYCMWQASLLDEDHEPALMYQSNFQQGIDESMSSETKEPTSTYSTITTLLEDM
jgi:hypothetical protein